jgi:hypothetical protein
MIGAGRSLRSQRRALVNSRSSEPLEVRDFGRAVAQLGSALGDQMQLLKEPAQLSERIFFIGRGEDQQLHAWAVTNGKH